MRNFTFLIALCSIFLFSFGKKEKTPHYHFNYDSSKALKKIPEPSDVFYDAPTNHLFIVSDHGMLFECDVTGKIIREAEETGMDFEGVEVKDSFIYVSDEKPRKVYKYRKNDLSLVKVYNVTWGGGFNKAFESITYNYTKNCFVLVSQQPAVVIEYDTNFHELQRYPLHFTRDVSDARWYNGDLYILGGMDHMIIKCDATTYEMKAYYDIDVINPEGLTFDKEGKVFIASDDLQKLFFFKKLPG